MLPPLLIYCGEIKILIKTAVTTTVWLRFRSRSTVVRHRLAVEWPSNRSRIVVVTTV